MDTDLSGLRRAWVEWEILRVVYNAVMFAQGFLWLALLRNHAQVANHTWCTSLHGPRLHYDILGDFLIANFVYCAGPLLQLYLMFLFGKDFPWCRRLAVLALLLGSSWMVGALGLDAWDHISSYR